MLQQTRVETVIDYYRRWLDALPTVRALAAASEDRVLKLWEGLGYYRRAGNLRRAARLIVNERHGRWPRTADEWQLLPGVGRYTAGAIASIAFGQPAPILDGNVKRVLARLFDVSESIDQAATIRHLWTAAERLVPRGVKNDPGLFNQALMELGAVVCLPRRPRCEQCPLRRRCAARARGHENRLPVRTPKKSVPHIQVVVAAIQGRGRNRGCYLLGKRPPRGMLAGLWEFPGGKVETGETHRQALARELKEELNIKVRVGEPIAEVDHVYSHLAVTIHLYACRIAAGRPRAIYHREIKWIRRAQFSRYAFPSANHKLIRQLRDPLRDAL